MGVVLNRRSEVTVDEAVPTLAEIVDGEELVHVGGPVQPHSIVVLGEFEDPEQAGVLVFGTVGFLQVEIEDGPDTASSHARGCSPAMRAGARDSSKESSPSRPGSSSRHSPTTYSPAIQRRSGASCCVARAVPSSCSRRCPPTRRSTDVTAFGAVGEGLIELGLEPAPDLAVTLGFGGDAANAAVMAARMGVTARFAGRVGTDASAVACVASGSRQASTSLHVIADPERADGDLRQPVAVRRPAPLRLSPALLGRLAPRARRRRRLVSRSVSASLHLTGITLAVSEPRARPRSTWPSGRRPAGRVSRSRSTTGRPSVETSSACAQPRRAPTSCSCPTRRLSPSSARRTRSSSPEPDRVRRARRHARRPRRGRRGGRRHPRGRCAACRSCRPRRSRRRPRRVRTSPPGYKA